MEWNKLDGIYIVMILMMNLVLQSSMQNIAMRALIEINKYSTAFSVVLLSVFPPVQHQSQSVYIRSHTN